MDFPVDEPESEQEQEDNPVWVPTMLEVTRRKLETQEHDKGQNGNRKCLLCELANLDTECQGKLSDILKFEREYRRSMQSDLMYKAITNKYNREIVRRRRETYNESNVPEITLSQVRQHFEGNHDRSWTRMLEDRLDYLHASADELERGGLWIKNIRDEGSLPQPNPKTFATYIAIATKMETLYHRLNTTQNQLDKSKVGKRR
jgi:hypothetical protein